MKKNLLIVLLVLSLVMTMTISGCAKTKDDSAAVTSEAPETSDLAEAVTEATAGLDHDITIGMTVKTLSSVFYADLKTGAEQALAEVNEATGRNHELVLLDDNKDLNYELNNVEDLINMGIDAMIFVPMDPSGSVPAYELLLAEEDIVTVIVDAPCDGSENCDAVIVSNNYEAGRLQMEKLAEAIGGKGKIVAISDSTNPNAATREAGLTDELKNWPDIELLEMRYIQSGVDAAMEAMTSMLNVYEEIDGVWTFSDTPAQGCVSAIESAGKLDQIKVTGIDCNIIARGLIREGKQYGSSAQFAVKLSYEGMLAVFDILEGNPPAEQTTYVDVLWVDSTNIEEFIAEYGE